MSADVSARAEDRIGNYRFVRVIHPGQQTTVMEVVQEGSGKKFVVKQLNHQDAKDPSARKAFEFEAKLGLELRHPNLIRVFEYHKEKGHEPFFVMEMFPSYHLRLAVGKPKEYGIARDRLRRVLEQSAGALAYMHEKGWIHRDIKPENILVNKSTEVRVIDYSLAMRPFSGLQKLFKPRVPCHGTHSYMSPEQILRGPPSVRADIYSFGITCYEMVCGRQPFRADSPTELLRKHLRDQPTPPISHNKDVTPEFSDLVMSMIKKKPADRPESLREFTSRLTRMKIFKDEEPPAPTF